MKHLKTKTNLARAAMTLLALFLFLGGTRALSSTLTVYDGTKTNSAVPAYINYWDKFTRSQFVIPATDLVNNEVNLTSAQITALTFYTKSANFFPYESVSTADVYLKEVDYTSISAFEPKSADIIVYSGTVTVVSNSDENTDGGLLTIVFSTPFTYEGGNLLIGIENTTKDGYKSITFYGQQVFGASVAGQIASGLADVKPSQKNFIPKTTITYEAGSGIVYEKPTDVAVDYTSDNTATVTWTSEAPSCDIDVNGEIIEGVTSPYTLTGLSLATTYNVKVRANYGGGNYSKWTTAVTFTTNDCMDADMCSINYKLIDTYGDGWDGNAIKVVDAATGEVLAVWTVTGETATGSLSLCPGKEIEFQWVDGDEDGYPNECYYEITDVNGDEILTGQGAMTETFSHIVDCTPATCFSPKDPTISYTGDLSAEVSWTSDADAFDLMVNGEIIEGVTKPYTLTNLTLSTIYEVRVRTNCGGGDYSKWSKAVRFKTNPCMNEDMCYITYDINVNSGYNQYGWYGSYLLVVDDETDELLDAWTVPQGDTDGKVTGETVVCAGQSLRFEWYSNGYVFSDSGIPLDDVFIGDIIVTDANGEVVINTTGALEEPVSYVVDCIVSEFKRPTELTASAVVATSVKLSWKENGEATSWVVAYKAPRDDDFTEVEAGTNPFTLTGLEPTTEYTVKVRPSGENTKWSNAISFTTAQPNPVPVDVVVTPAHTSATISWAGESDSYEVKYRTAAIPAEIFFDDFENGLDQWTIDGTGTPVSTNDLWYTINPTNGLSFEAHSGTYAASSWSWNSNAYNANNWLITPQVTFGTMLKFWVRTNANYPDHYAVLLSTSGNTINTYNGNNFVSGDFTVTLQELATAPATGEWEEVAIDISDYTGQEGYIAIYHKDYDANYLLIDDFGIYGDGGVPAGEWTTIETDETSVEITGLEMDTKYEYQIIGIMDGRPNEGTALATFTTLSGNDKVFTTAGNWDVASNWYPAGVPEANDKATIQADAIIPAGVVATAKDITIDGGSITIKDGAQLKTKTEDLVVTVEKNIEAGKSYLMASPFYEYVDPTDVSGMTESNYNLYGFESTQENEWLNYNQYGFSLSPYNGYFYSNDEAKTLSYTGPILYTNDFWNILGIEYDEESTDFFNGTLLIGNPFVCTGYFSCLDTSGEVMPAYFFKLNAAGTGYDLYYEYVALEPGEAAFMMYGDSGYLYYGSDPLFEDDPEVQGTYNIAALPEFGLNTDQDANPILELNFAAEGFATYYDSGYGLELPAGVKARIVTAQNGVDKLTYETIADGDLVDAATNKVPADTPVMLQVAPAANAQTVAVRLGIGAPAINSTNLLKGSDEETTTTGGDKYYKLTYSNNNDNFGWYWGAENGAAFVSPEGKAWLALPATGTRFYALPGFDGESFGLTTGVDSQFATDAEEDGDWYSVDGRKLNMRPKAKGVYILNGKKTIVK